MFINEERNTETSEYDEKGNCIEKIDALGNKSTFLYDKKSNLIKSTDAEGHTTRYEYDSNRNVTKIIYPTGTSETFEYDDHNRLVSSTDLRGLETKNKYDENGLLIETKSGDRVISYTYENGNVKTVTDACGNVTSFDYDENGHLKETKSPDGAVIKTTVSSYGNVLSKEDPFLNLTSTTYNWVDKPLTKVDEEGNVVTCTYNALELLESTTDAKGNKTEYFYDKEERLIKTVFPDGTLTQNKYDKAGRLVSTIDAEGKKTGFVYDENGNVIKETDKMGRNTTYTYNKNGQVLTKTDPKGNKTENLYDPMGRVVAVKDANGGVTRYNYSRVGNMTSIIDALGNTTRFTYDEYGQKISEKDPKGNKTLFEYDLNGNLIKSTDALGNTTVFEYDTLNRLVSRKTLDRVEKYEYDLLGRVVSETDPNGNVTRKVYDKRGNVSKVIDALGHETSYVYDKNNNLVSATNAKGQTITYEINSVNQVTKVTDALGLEKSLSYDKNGRLKSSTNPMGGLSQNIFDAKGNITTLIGPGGAKTTFRYDSNNNVTYKSTIDGNAVIYTYNSLDLLSSMTNGRDQSFEYNYDLLGRVVKSTSYEGEITYQYDKNSNIVSVTDQNGTITRTFDALNRVTSMTDTLGNTVSYVYDSYGNMVKLIYPDEVEVDYTFDLCGNIKTVTDWQGKVTKYNYDSLNREIESFNTNGTRTEKNYDEVGNITRIAVYEDYYSTNLTAETALEYDSINRLISETETLKNRKYEYSYDNLSRVLSRKTIDMQTGVTIDEETFCYDNAGNILSSTEKEAKRALSYVSNDNRIDTADGVKFTFDNDGNLVSGKLFDTDSTLIYDSKNRLTSFNSNSYVYDAEYYRILSKTKDFSESKSEEIPENVEPVMVDLLEMYNSQFSAKDSTGKDIKISNSNGLSVTTYLHEDSNGNWCKDELTSGIIDISEYDFIEMEALNALVYLDGELVYDGREGKSKTVEKRFNVSDKSGIEIKSICPKSSRYTNMQGGGYRCQFRLLSLNAGAYPKPQTEENTNSEEIGEIGNNTAEEAEQVKVDLLDKYYQQFSAKKVSGVRDTSITAKGNKVSAKIFASEDDEGNWFTGELTSGVIDVSEYDFVEMKSLNAMVYLDDELVYDGREGKLNPIEMRFDVSGKSKLEIKSSCSKITTSYAPQLGGYFSTFNLLSLSAGVKAKSQEEENKIDEESNSNDNNSSEDVKLISVDLLDKYYPQFSAKDSGGNDIEVKKSECLFATLYIVEDDMGNLYTSELTSGIIDVSEYDFVEMKSLNAMVYLDDELVYDGREGKSTPIEKRFDVSDKSRMEIRCYCPESADYRGQQGIAYRCRFKLWSLIAFANENVGEIVGTSSIESLDSTDEAGNDANDYSQTNPTDDTIDSVEESGNETIDSSVSQNESSGEEQNNLNIESDVSENELASSDVSSNELVFFDVSTNELEESDVSENEIDAELFVESVEEPKNETISFCYDRVNKNLLMTTSYDGRIQYFIYGNGLICSYEDRETEDDLAWSRFECYSYDLRGSVTTVTNERGKLISEYEYSTYGTRTIISGEDSILGYCARDGVLTEPNGLLYMRARYYSPELMRFMNQDIITGDISNSNSLNRYTYVEGNPVTLIDPFGLCAKKINDLRNFLLECQWDEECLSDRMVSNLYNTLIKYQILSKKQICMFLAQCKVESGDGTSLYEIGDEEYYKEHGYDSVTCGSGYIQMTGDAERYAYATYMMQTDHPELEKCGKYLPPAHYDAGSIKELYYAVINEAESIMGVAELKKYTDIVDIGSPYIAVNYAWDSSGYYWTMSKELNQDVADGASMAYVNVKVGGLPSRYGEKESAYNVAMNLFDSYSLGDLGQ